MVAIFDVDETLLSTFSEFLDWHNKEYGTKFMDIHFTDYHWEKVFGISHNKLYKRHTNFLKSDEALKTVDFCYGAEGLIELIKEKGDDIILLTDRDYSLKNRTYDSFQKHSKDIKDIIFTTKDLGKNKIRKVDVLKDLKAKLYMEDSKAHAEAAHAAGIYTIIVSKYWNNDHNLPCEQHVSNLGLARRLINKVYDV